MSATGFSQGGGVSAPSIVTDADGNKWSLVLDVPIILAKQEQLCLAWARHELAKKLQAYPERDVKGTLDERRAEALMDQWDKDFDNGEFLPGPPPGKQYERYMTTTEGKLSVVLSAILYHHPKATVSDALKVMTECGDELTLVFRRFQKKVEQMRQTGQKTAESIAVPTHSASSPD